MHSLYNANDFLSPKPSGISHVLFSIGSMSVHTYSLTMMLGILAAILSIVFFWKREKYPIEILLVLIIITIPSSMIGARLWFVIERAIYSSPENPFNFADWYKIWEGGLSIQGGVILAAVLDLIYVWFKRHQVDMLKAISIIIPNILIGQVIGRFGNYANHEVYGTIDFSGSSALWAGSSFANNMYIASGGIAGAFRQPLFFIEAMLSLLGWIILVWLINGMWLLKPGSTGALYFVWYGIVRMIMEPYRDESYDMYTIASAVFIVVGMFFFLICEFMVPNYKRVWNKKYIRFDMINLNPYVKVENNSTTEVNSEIPLN